MSDPRQQLYELLGRCVTLLYQLEPSPSPQPKPAAAPTVTPQPETQASDDDEMVIVRPLSRVFEMVGVKKTLGYEMLKPGGPLERVKLGKRAAGVTLRSIRRLQQRGG